MKNKYFYIKQENEIRGPLLASTLDKLYSAGTLSAETPVSVDKQTWTALEDTLYRFHEQQEPVVSVPSVQPDVIPLKTESVPEPSVTPVLIPVQEKTAESCFETPDVEVSDWEPDIAKDDFWEVAGESLHLMWNAPDKLESMTHFSSRSIFRIMLPVCLIFTLFVSQAAAVSVAFFWGNYMQKMIFVLLFTMISLVLYFLELLLLSLKNKNEYRQRLVHTLILSGMSWISFGAVTGVGALHFALSVLAGKDGMPFWVIFISSAFFLFVCCFSFCNMAAGLRIGLCSFFGFRPRNAVWCSALFLWQYFMLLYAGFLLAKKFII